GDKTGAAACRWARCLDRRGTCGRARNTGDVYEGRGQSRLNAPTLAAEVADASRRSRATIAAAILLALPKRPRLRDAPNAQPAHAARSPRHVCVPTAPPARRVARTSEAWRFRRPNRIPACPEDA